ncbi:uncharacterized protein LOC126738855 [Anthonomus grandis grandis]|uniref:uncharacterized protein LOC126738855 n=1 Tax=Anthonomus grandis grandis TaxID=2921223 RepID=UPI002165415D|nr:uncharacterized protein LOC126738855 [Anthonomus grandis grandis]XP_050300274.1 uncharacterized protein LOC126738855 [Anthonomus grandis grandis]XP_050300275.1 uncharacterized protein LOC126738855 [Anthonomus grandis grandis]XP_050300276.1 uncharacterized protein LOC126738855 [Anthonomus grandis grandis]
MLTFFYWSCFITQVCLAKAEILRGPPEVEKNPKFSGSYIPAAMQIIAHDTELMKYVIKPPQGTTTTTTTTIRPTPSHRPAVFAPTSPIGPTAYFSQRNLKRENQKPYSEKYYPLTPEGLRWRALGENEDIYERAEHYLGKAFGDVLKLANRIDVDDDQIADEEKVLEFSKVFEDSDSPYRFELLRQKRVPPTKAYVTLLTLYDLLNGEAKRLMLNRYNGFTEEVLNNLVNFSTSTSSNQLKATLKKIIEKGDTRKENVMSKIKSLIMDLEQENSYINNALKDIPPLSFMH